MTTLIEEKGIVKGVIYKNKAGEELRTYAPLTIVCDVCFSNLRKSLSAPKVTMAYQQSECNFITGVFVFS